MGMLTETDGCTCQVGIGTAKGYQTAVTIVGQTCTCPGSPGTGVPGTIYSSATKYCECPSVALTVATRTRMIWDAATSGCICPPDSTRTSGTNICECTGGKVRDATTLLCVSPL